MKKGITRRVISGLGVAVAMILMANSAYALPQLRLTSGAATCTLSDNAAAAVCAGGATGSFDLSAIDGAVAGTFTLGVWTVNVSTGITKPFIGTAASPYMDLNTVNVSSGAGTLTVEFTETDFTGTGSSRIVFGGTSNGNGGSVTYSAYASALNTAFAQTTLLATSGLMGPGAYSGDIAGGGPLGALYSLTQVVTYTHTGAGSSSGDHELIVPDSASAFMLLGLGLVGLAFARWSAL